MTLTGREKATIFLSILGADVSSRVLRYLPDELADLVAAGINHLPSPSPEALASVMDEFQSFLALPESTPPSALSAPAVPRRSYASLMYERPQMIAFLISLMTEEERAEALHSLPRERSIVEELLNTMKPTPLRAKLEDKLKEVFAGKIF